MSIRTAAGVVEGNAVRLGLRENWVQFSLLVLVNAFVGTMVGVERSVLSILAEQEFGVASATAALSFLVAFGLAKAIANFLAGHFAESVGRRRILLIGWTFALPVPFLLAWAPTWGWVIFANLLLGLNQGLAWSATVIMKIDLVGPRQRGLAMGLNEFAGYVAVALAALGAGYMAVEMGPRSGPVWIGGAAALLGLVVTLLFVRDTGGHVELEHEMSDRAIEGGPDALPPGFRARLWQSSWTDPALFATNQAGFVNNLNDGLAWGLFPLFFAAAGLSMREIGWLAALYPAVWGIAQIATGALSDRTGRRSWIVGGMMLQAGALAIFALASGFVWWALAAVALGLGTAAVYPTLIAQVSDLVAPRDRASCVGIYRLWRDLGYVAGGLLAGVLADLLGYRPAIGIVAALTAGSGLLARAHLPLKRPAIILLAGLIWASPAAAQLPAPADPGVSPDLYSFHLVPAPGFSAAEGVVQMGRARSPFGVAVTRDGTHLFDLTVAADGLPEPSTLDGATTYIAWATTPALAPMIKLGEVGRGAVARRRVGLDKFMVLVTAERSADVTERHGRIVLRGTSPSMRMLPHDTPYLMMSLGGDVHDDHAPAPPTPVHHHGGPDATELEWAMPPMHPRVQMPPGMDHLRPSVRPFLPDAPSGEIVEARLREVLRVSDGDTIDLTAQPVRRYLAGTPVVTYGYNGQVPGPLIRADEGATIVVRLHNRTDFPSSVHWHGIRLDNRFDGVPGVTQPAVPPGESFTYEVHLPDPGIYWYHPHVREDVKQALGLHGNVRVDAPERDHLNPVHSEQMWMLGDLLVGERGLEPYGLEGPTHAMMGRFGNVLLVNGDPEARLEVDRGEIVRFFLTNVASTRTFNLSFGGAPIKLIASDLSRFEREEWVESVVIAPAERYIVEVRFDSAGEVAVENRVRAIDHVYGNFFQEIDTLAVVRVSEREAPVITEDFQRLRTHPEVVAEIASLGEHLRRPPDREIVLLQETRDLRFPLRQLMQLDSAYFNPVEWSGTMPMMNWVVTSNEVSWILRDPASGRENMEMDWRFTRGDLVRIRIRNEREVLHAMQHPIHIHGQRFLVLSMNGVPNDNLVWKDTFLMPVGWTAELLVEMSNPGDWMFHCHISEHLESGMMAVFHVDP